MIFQKRTKEQKQKLTRTHQISLEVVRALTFYFENDNYRERNKLLSHQSCVIYLK